MPTAVATDRFVIRTASGDKGPFTRAQIAAFVAAGKLQPTAKILDVDAQRAVTAADVVATPSPSMPSVPRSDENDLTPDAGSRIDPNAVTPGAPGTRIPFAPNRATRAGGAKRGRGKTEAGSRAKRRKRTSPALFIALGVAAVALIVVGGFAVAWMRSDHASELAASLAADALAHPESLAPAPADPAYLRALVRRYSPQALADAKLMRGSLSQYKPGYDPVRYRASLSAAIGTQLATPDAMVVDACARELIMNDRATSAEIAAAKTLAQQAVTMDGEKNYRSLLTLARAYHRSGDAARAALIAEQAVEIAPDSAAKAECGNVVGSFRSAKPKALKAPSDADQAATPASAAPEPAAADPGKAPETVK